MRPIEKAKAPKPTYKQYNKAKPDLEAQLGSYCSYCEYYDIYNLAVEHILPKTKYPELENDWDNFLLACSKCNSFKGDKYADAIWPHTHNPIRHIVYHRNGFVSVNPSNDAEYQSLAQTFLELVGTNRNQKAITDRATKYTIAEVLLKAFESSINDTEGSDNILKHIILIAQNSGYWSIWMHVFQHHPAVRRRLIDAFPGTARQCFDAETKPLHR